MVALNCSMRTLLFGTLLLASTVCVALADSSLERPQADAAERFTIYFFDREGSAAATEMWRVLEGADPAFQARVEIIRVREEDPGSLNIKRQYGVITTPFTLVVAPSGTVTGGHAGVVGIPEIRRSLVSPPIQTIIAAAQQRQVIFVVLPGSNELTNSGARAAARKVEATLGRTVAVVEMDPNAAEDLAFLANLGVDQLGSDTTVVVLSSAGLVDRLDGEISSTRLLLSFQSVLASNSGCGGANEGGLKTSCKE